MTGRCTRCQMAEDRWRRAADAALRVRERLDAVRAALAMRGATADDLRRAILAIVGEEGER